LAHTNCGTDTVSRCSVWFAEHKSIVCESHVSFHPSPELLSGFEWLLHWKFTLYGVFHVSFWLWLAS